MWSMAVLAGFVIMAECAGSEQATPSARRLIVPDDYATVQAAILAARAGDTIFIKAGTYQEALRLKSGVKLAGEEIDKVTVQFRETKNVVTIEDCNDVSISGLTIKHVATLSENGGKAGIVVDNSTVVITRCRVTEAIGNGISVGAKANATIDSCTVSDNGAWGIHVGKNGTATIRDCEVARHLMSGIMLAGRGAKGTVRHCRITGSGLAGIAFWMGATGTAEENDTWDNHVGIQVRDDCHDVVLSKNRCHDNEQDGIQIHGGAQARAEQNLCEDNTSHGIGVSGEKTKAVIEKNRCLTNGEYGILVCRDAEGVITGNECAKNEKAGIYVNDTSVEFKVEGNSCRENGQAGITLYETGGGVLTNNTCEHNTLKGIYAHTTSGMVMVSMNRCMWNEEDGISFTRRTQSTLQNNTCSHNGQGGIILFHGARSLAQANVCEGNRCPGIWVEDPNTVVTLRKNACCANNDSGILFVNVTDSKAEGNICLNNTWSGIAVRGEKTKPTLTGNQCNDNGAWGIISWAGADPNVAADNETLDNWKGGIKHRSPSDEQTETARQI